MVIVLWTLILLCTIASLRSLPVPEEQDGEIVNIELIGHHNDHRVRREAGESRMPDVIVMKFTITGNDVILRLRRVRCPPVYFLGSAEPAYEHAAKDSAVFVDPTRYASFMVSRSDAGHFLLDGNLKHFEQQLALSPRRNRRSANGNEHFVTAIESQDIDFGDDSVNLPTDESDDQTTDTVGREARAARTIVHTVETTFVIDYKDFTNWQERFPTDTLNNLNEYYTYIGETVNMIYKSVKDVNSLLDIKVVVKEIIVLQNASDSYTEVLNKNASNFSTEVLNKTVNGSSNRNISEGQLIGEKCLNEFETWLSSHSHVLPKSDHYVTFTGYDLVHSGGNYIGFAFTGGMCNGTHSVSIVENSFQGRVALSTAHELGHSLGSTHDGHSDECSPVQQHIMSSVFTLPVNISAANSTNIFHFSSCSVRKFRNFLSRKRCTLPSQTTTPNTWTPTPTSESHLIKDRDFQCIEAMNNSLSRYINVSSDEEICYGMLCVIESVWEMSVVLPFEGTPCGEGKVCEKGVCVKDTTNTTSNSSLAGIAPPVIAMLSESTPADTARDVSSPDTSRDVSSLANTAYPELTLEAAPTLAAVTSKTATTSATSQSVTTIVPCPGIMMRKLCSFLANILTPFDICRKCGSSKKQGKH